MKPNDDLDSRWHLERDQVIDSIRHPEGLTQRAKNYLKMIKWEADLERSIPNDAAWWLIEEGAAIAQAIIHEKEKS